MTTLRETNIVSIVNNNEDPSVIGGLNEEEQAYYDGLLKEKADFKAETGKELKFYMPMESYNDLW